MNVFFTENKIMKDLPGTSLYVESPVGLELNINCNLSKITKANIWFKSIFEITKMG
jgi:hypothetical protein